MGQMAQWSLKVTCQSREHGHGKHSDENTKDRLCQILNKVGLQLSAETVGWRDEAEEKPVREPGKRPELEGPCGQGWQKMPMLPWCWQCREWPVDSQPVRDETDAQQIQSLTE